MKIVAIDTYPLILAVDEIYGGAAGVLEDCRSLIVRVDHGKVLLHGGLNIARTSEADRLSLAVGLQWCLD